MVYIAKQGETLGCVTIFGRSLFVFLKRATSNFRQYIIATRERKLPRKQLFKFRL
jgi:hypothetical protein